VDSQRVKLEGRGGASVEKSAETPAPAIVPARRSFQRDIAQYNQRAYCVQYRQHSYTPLLGEVGTFPWLVMPRVVLASVVRAPSARAVDIARAGDVSVLSSRGCVTSELYVG